MRILSALAAIPLAILFVSWLSLRSLNTNAEIFDSLVAELNRFSMLEAALRRDVLNARVGTLRNYDPLVREINGLDASMLRLREAAPPGAKIAILVRRLSASLTQQEEEVERFKGDNALLQNSLAYLDALTGQPNSLGTTEAAAVAVTALTTAILRLTLDTSPVAVADVQSRLDDLAMQTKSLDKASPTRVLLAHGHLLVELLPATDHILKMFSAERTDQDMGIFRAAVVERQTRSRMTARRFRLILYVASLILIGLLAQLGMQLRSRAQALQRRAALEHVIARISMYLLTTRTGEVGSGVGRALGDLAACLEADRAYFLSSDSSSKTELWCPPGTAFPEAWPDRAPTLAAQLNATAAGLIHIPSIDRLAAGPVREMFAELNLRGWAYISCVDDNGWTTALGFDVMRRRGRFSWSSELGLLRMALDTIINARGRERLDHERASLQARVQQAQRLETVGALASGVAHNFNNILGAIMGYTELAEAEALREGRAATNLAEIRRAGERARVLVDQLLTFGRRRETRRRPVNMQNLVSESTAMLRASLPATVDIVVYGLHDPVTVAGEHAQLQQVILNICHNAAQAMEEVGRIDIDVRVHSLPTRLSLSHGELEQGRYVCLAVDDSGRGMDSATLERVFEPFFTTREGGNGLGLATVRDIVREHHGAMHVVSSPRRGTRFETWLPCTDGERAAPHVTAPSPPRAMGMTVLVIDGDREGLLRTEELLAALECEPVGFMEEAVAFQACREEPTRFDIVLIAHRGPSSLLLKNAAQLHDVLPGLPILLATHSAVDLSAETLSKAGISDVLHLPLKASEIAAVLERVRDGDDLWSLSAVH